MPKQALASQIAYAIPVPAMAERGFLGYNGQVKLSAVLCAFIFLLAACGSSSETGGLTPGFLSTNTPSAGSQASGASTDPVSTTTPPAGSQAGGATPDPGSTITPSGLQYVDLVVGDGAEPNPGATVTVHYTGWLEDGTKFDSSVDSGSPFDFVIGQGRVIKGWDEGVASMKVGGKRRLTILPDLAYGSQGFGAVIPPNATLVFEVELLGVSGGTAATQETQERRSAIMATINTNLGSIVIELFPNDAPKTVDNFVKLSKDGFYDGVIFHRVIPNFMIQGGDPTGTGTGGPGYQFEDEFVPSLVFDTAGILAMANSGPNTNGSQFFITTVPTPHLNGRHTIFGKVTGGQDVLDAISAVARGSNDKPLEDVVIQGVVIDESS